VNIPIFSLADRHHAQSLQFQLNEPEYAWRHYTGEYVTPNLIRNYLHRKTQRESDAMYAERCLWADPSMQFSTVVDELVGMVAGNDPESSRQWVGELSNNLGDPAQADSPANRMDRDCDGMGTNWVTFWREVGIRMTVFRRTWVLVDGVADGKEATLHHVFPWDVIAVRFDNYGRLIEAVVRTTVDGRTSITDDASSEDRYTLFTIDGWRRFKDKALNEPETEFQAYAYYLDSSRTTRTLPLFNCDLPLQRNVGYLLARKVNAIFNMESVRDYAVRNITFNFLRLVANDDEFQKITEALSAGTNVLQQNPAHSAQHDFMALDTGMVASATEVVEKKIGEFYKAAFKEYNDAASIRTATEIVHKSQSSLNAFLTLLSGALDEAENGALWRVSQVYNPLNPTVWQDSYVKRSTDFVPMDIEHLINGLVSRYFPTGVPTSPGVRKQVLSQVYRLDNVEETGDVIDGLVGNTSTPQ
jgi:hypothetical protein